LLRQLKIIERYIGSIFLHQDPGTLSKTPMGTQDFEVQQRKSEGKLNDVAGDFRQLSFMLVDARYIGGAPQVPSLEGQLHAKELRIEDLTPASGLKG
jgi:hypothetical protein